MARNSEGWEIFSKRFTKETLPLFKTPMKSQDVEKEGKEFHLGDILHKLWGFLEHVKSKHKEENDTKS